MQTAESCSSGSLPWNEHMAAWEEWLLPPSAFCRVPLYGSAALLQQSLELLLLCPPCFQLLPLSKGVGEMGRGARTRVAWAPFLCLSCQDCPVCRVPAFFFSSLE